MKIKFLNIIDVTTNMKLTLEQLKKIESFVREKINENGNDTFHGIYHTKETVRLSRAIAIKEKADVNKSIDIGTQAGSVDTELSIV